jgi:hypothetical protein
LIPTSRLETNISTESTFKRLDFDGSKLTNKFHFLTNNNKFQIKLCEIIYSLNPRDLPISRFFYRLEEPEEHDQMGTFCCFEITNGENRCRLGWTIEGPSFIYPAEFQFPLQSLLLAKHHKLQQSQVVITLQHFKYSNLKLCEMNGVYCLKDVDANKLEPANFG